MTSDKGRDRSVKFGAEALEYAKFRQIWWETSRPQDTTE